MARFVFKLDPVIEVRRRAERDKRLVVARLETERMQIERDIARAQAAARLERQDLRDRLDSSVGPIDLWSARTQAHASLRALGDVNQAALRMAGVEAKLRTAREHLRAASAERKSIELLRERRYEEWKREQMRGERLETDEIGAVMTSSGKAGDA